MTPIRDFNDTELWVVRTTLKERYGREVELEFADAELRLDPLRPVLTSCPALLWTGHEASFAIFKTGEERYRCQFHYSGREQYGTGIREYTDIAECVTTLLQTQADHFRTRHPEGLVGNGK
jgi:hypothetical protein